MGVKPRMVRGRDAPRGLSPSPVPVEGELSHLRCHRQWSLSHSSRTTLPSGTILVRRVQGSQGQRSLRTMGESRPMHGWLGEGCCINLRWNV